jgi:hypothetical protein
MAGWVGLALPKKMKPPKPRPSPPPSKTALAAEKWILDRMREKFVFQIFD